MTEYDEAGEAVIHGYCDGTETEVLFELQNLTEVGGSGFRAPELHVGLCGLAYRARVCSREMDPRWLPLERAAPSRAAHENDWILRGRVIAFKPLINPLSGTELYWIYVHLDRLKLEVLVNARALTGGTLEVISEVGHGTRLQLCIPYPGEDGRDPVCGMAVEPDALGAEHAGKLYRFCSPACRDLFLTQPAVYVVATLE